MNNLQGEGKGDSVEGVCEWERRKKENCCLWNWNMKVYNCGIFKKAELSLFITYFVVIYGL